MVDRISGFGGFRPLQRFSSRFELLRRNLERNDRIEFRYRGRKHIGRVMDLRKMVKEGRFRKDLFHRLNVFRVSLPRLRKRGRDILLLAREFLRRLPLNRFGQCGRFFRKKYSIRNWTLILPLGFTARAITLNKGRDDSHDLSTTIYQFSLYCRYRYRPYRSAVRYMVRAFSSGMASINALQVLRI